MGALARHGSPSRGTPVPTGSALCREMLKPRVAPGPTPLLSRGSPHFSHVSGNSTSRKILRFVDKIAKSKYFQKATENEFIKKKIEEVSNTPLLLTVEVQELVGTLAVNIPPPPTDRVWYQLLFLPRGDPRVSCQPCVLPAAWGRDTFCLFPSPVQVQLPSATAAGAEGAPQAGRAGGDLPARHRVDREEAAARISGAWSAKGLSKPPVSPDRQTSVCVRVISMKNQDLI